MSFFINTRDLLCSKKLCIYCVECKVERGKKCSLDAPLPCKRYSKKYISQCIPHHKSGQVNTREGTATYVFNYALYGCIIENSNATNRIHNYVVKSKDGN